MFVGFFVYGMIIKLDQVYCKKGVIMKLYLIIILLGSKLFGQCDANYDGVLDIFDVLIEVDCVINDCWGDTSITVTDIDGNVYETVLIGEQRFMMPNLIVEHFQNGNEIPNVTDNADWSSLSTPAFSFYDDDEENSGTYGYLYNRYAITDDRKIFPEGWHVPSNDDWQTLVDYLDGNEITGGTLKAIGTLEEGDGLWYAPNEGATNEVGFTAIPGGYRRNDGNYFDMGYISNFWSSTQIHENAMWIRAMFHNSAHVGNLSYSNN